MSTFIYSAAVSYIGLRAKLQERPADHALQHTIRRQGSVVAFVLGLRGRFGASALSSAFIRPGGRIDGPLSNRLSNRRWGSPSTAANRLMAPAGDIMRTLLIADVHANLAALQALPVADTIICAGDLVGFGSDPDSVIDWLR